jgi:hypothetical protein
MELFNNFCIVGHFNLTLQCTQYGISVYNYYTPDVIFYGIPHGFLNFSLVFSMCVNKDVLEGCRAYLVYMFARHGARSLYYLPTNGMQILQLRCSARWSHEMSPNLLDKQCEGGAGVEILFR